MLVLQNVEKVLHHRRVLSVESLSLHPGDIAVVVGTAGSGKSLLLQLIVGQIPLSSGSVLWEGQPVNAQTARQHVGYLWDDDLLYDRLSVWQNLRFACDLWGEPYDRISVALEQVGLRDHHHDIVGTLTPPLQRRLAFARLLLRSTAIWLLDSPTARTDTDTRDVLRRLILEAAAAGGIVVLAEEELSWAGKVATRVLELEAGRLTEGSAGIPSIVVSQHHTPYKISARQEDRIVLYDPGDVLYITSIEGKTVVKTNHEEAIAPLPLQELEERLQGRGFFRAHRAYLVNLQHVKAVIQFTRNSYTLLLNDAAESQIPLSKNAEKELQERLGY